MSSTIEFPGRKARRALTATAAAVALAFGSLAAAAPAAAAPAESPDLPEVIPSIEGWQPSEGAFAAEPDIAIAVATDNDRLDSIAGILRDELAVDYVDATVAGGAAEAGDIELRLDEGRDDLGAEGYELQVEDTIVITAAEPAGVLYGTRTVLQMLMQQSTLPQGSLVDVPAYEERGVTVCACVINISTEFIDRLIEEMAFLKLNTMLVELKVKVDAYPQTNTWSYYDKDALRTLVEKARAYGIDVIPEINSPGHMEIWLENFPELQLTNERTGAKDEVRMDITKDASYEFYTDLIDEYFEVFDSDYWHMGVDEYMLGSGYANYPQIKRFAQEQFAADATENDVVAWYVNKVNDYVKSKGKTLRIWNDGVMTTNKYVQFDTDIIVEHWNQAGSSIRPQQFLDWGHQVANISNSLYMVRGSYGVNSRSLYNSGWTPEVFYGQTVTSGIDQILGARMSIWPDGGTPAEAENTTEARMFEPLRFVAQATWADSRPWETFDAFRAAMDTIGRSPLWDEVNRQPLPNGAFTIATDAGALSVAEDGSLVLGEGTPLTFARTDDGYYTIRTADGRCLDLTRDGTMRLNVPVEIGVGLQVAACSTTTLQKWQLRKVDGGYTLANAASQQFVSVSEGLVDVPVAREGFKDVPDGLVVQTPGDWGRTVWSVVGDVALSASPASVQLAPGDSTGVTVSITNMTGQAIEGATVRVAALPTGFTALPASVAIDTVAPTESASAAFTVHNISSTSGTGSIAFELVAADGSVIATSSAAAAAMCSVETIRPTAVTAVSSEQTTGEPAPNGPAIAAIDGNPATYWHTRWSPSEAPYPHTIVVDLGAEQSVCGLWYTGRASAGTGGANGRIADYEVYASDSVASIDGAWGEPVATGTFENSANAQFAGFPAQQARYLKLVALSEAAGNPWATIGELAAAGPVQDAPVYEPSMQLSADTVEAGDEVTVEATGFAPGETVTVELAAGEAAETRIAAAAEPITARADADGTFVSQLPVPADTAAGEYRVVLTGVQSGAATEAELTVTAAPGGDPGETPAPGDGSGADAGDGDAGSGEDAGGALADTGAAVGGAIAAGVLLLLAGLAFVLLRRRGAARSL